MKPDINNQKGFTLIELMIAMAIASIVAAAMFGFQEVQTRGHVTQSALTEMQQNARAAMHFMTSEIRMAGCDPRGTAGARIIEASDDEIRFSIDFTGGLVADRIEIEFPDNIYTLSVPDGIIGPGEDITYRLNNGDLERFDNITDTATLIAQDIEALNFIYLDADGVRIVDTNTNANLASIRSIQVTTLARSDMTGLMYRHSDTQTYRNQALEDLIVPNPPNDNARRILLSTEVRLRNRE